MHYVVTLKVYSEIDENVEKRWYRVKNGQEVIDMQICSGDTMLIDGIGKLEVFGVEYKSRDVGSNPYRALTITCGLVNENIVDINGRKIAI